MRWYSLYNFIKVCVLNLIDLYGSRRNRSAQFKGSVSTNDFRRLLKSLSNDVGCFRCRCMDQPWTQHYCKICDVREDVVLLYDEKDTKYYMVNIHNVLQFDINKRWRNLKAHHRYGVYTVNQQQEVSLQPVAQ